MMWSDMYFRINADDGFRYYQKELVISGETKKAIPEQIELVYWHYGEELRCDGYVAGKTDRIEELDEPHLAKYLNGFDGPFGIAMPV